ncbi:hypothetical protein AFR_18785 [Actinoplanes friuliensis DSM 7358]|uniref:Big-1 domain-containing protein n=1 Tax=Actinoplanes friuliensis DSM 7358 TaxID=1246995 RepID=U5VYH2_9ACTN|nr:hypothetical protein AFR_18785 [Actinoplanes friuliensis DSM 7358]
MLAGSALIAVPGSASAAGSDMPECKGQMGVVALNDGSGCRRFAVPFPADSEMLDPSEGEQVPAGVAPAQELAEGELPDVGVARPVWLPFAGRYLVFYPVTSDVVCATGAGATVAYYNGVCHYFNIPYPNFWVQLGDGGRPGGIEQAPALTPRARYRAYDKPVWISHGVGSSGAVYYPLNYNPSGRCDPAADIAAVVVQGTCLRWTIPAGGTTVPYTEELAEKLQNAHQAHLLTDGEVPETETGPVFYTYPDGSPSFRTMMVLPAGVDPADPSCFPPGVERPGRIPVPCPSPPVVVVPPKQGARKPAVVAETSAVTLNRGQKTIRSFTLTSAGEPLSGATVAVNVFVPGARQSGRSYVTNSKGRIKVAVAAGKALGRGWIIVRYGGNSFVKPVSVEVPLRVVR